jgi:hypothetical protein
MSSFNNNNNNNNSHSHNRYVVPVAGPSTTGSTIPIPIGGYRPAAAIAARNSGRKAPIRCATAPVACVSPPVASSNIPSAGASDSSCNSAPAERTSGYIHRGRIVPLPKADKLRKAPSHGPSCARVVRADPAEVQTFRAGLKAGNNSPLVSGNFPPLVPSHFLKTQDDARKNAGPSFSSIAAKGVKPGAKISLRSLSSSLPSWSETWTKNEDWVLVPPGQEDLLQRGLGSGFRVQFAGDLWEGICEVDEMAPRNGASGDFWLGLVKRWLKEQALIRELVDCSVYPLEYIELIGASGKVDKMYRLASRKDKPATPPKKRSPAPPSPPKLYPSSSSEFPTRKDKGKGKARDVYISQSERDKLKLKLDQYKESLKNPNSLVEKPLSGYYVNGKTKRPSCMDAPVPPVPERGSTTAGSSAIAAYEAALKTYNEQREVQIVWDRADNKALGIIQLRMADKLQYLIRDTSLQSWANIKSQFDVSGPAAIFVDFKFVINFKFDDRKEPAVQVAELNTRLNCLATHGFNLDYRIQAMIILSGLPQSWDSVQGSILANHDMADLSISVIMPILQEEWQRRQARRGEHKSSHLARGGMHGAPQRQYWQGNQNNSGYTPQAGPSNYNSGYKPAPYKKFSKKPNYKPNNQNPGYNSNNSGSKGPNGPNWERNHQNRQNKKQARMLLKEQVAKLESQSKPDTRGKKKEKAGKSANLLARIDDIPLESRMEDIDSYNERVLIAPKSNKTNVVKQIVDKMDVDNEDAVSLGNESVYLNARDYYANNALDGDDWDKYGDGLLNKEFANINHTVPIMEEMAKQPSSSSQHHSSNVVNAASCNKTVYTVNRVIKANEAKTSLLAEIGDDTWIIDSGASHHITTKLTDYTSYQPYPEPEIQ